MIIVSASQLRAAGYPVTDDEYGFWTDNGFVVRLERLYDEWPWYKKIAWKLGVWKP